MAYRDDGQLDLSDLREHERLAFGALMRAILSDGGYQSPQTRAQVQDIAEGVEPAVFWEALHQARELTAVEMVEQLAAKVKRRGAQELIFALLYEVAMVGSISASEQAVLDGLTELWDIKVEFVPDPR